MKLFKLFLAALLINGPMGCSVAVAAAGDTRIRADYVDGQDSSRSYIKDGDAETGTAVLGWSCYADAAGVAPVDGAGGSPNVTFTKTTSSPLENLKSFVFTKDAANRQGQGCSYDFTIDARLKSKMLQITFDNLVGSGTFAAGSDSTNSDVMVYLYDVTNSKLVPLQGQTKFYSNSTTLSESFKAWFQAAPDSVNYRLILHVASTSTSAFTLKQDIFKVSESKQVVGTIITELQSWDPTLSFATGSTSAAITKNCQWRRVGDIGEYYCDINFGAGTIGTWTVPYVSLPAGHVIDTTNGPASLISSVPCRANVGNAYPGVSTVPAVNTIGCRVNSVTTHTGTAPAPESDITSTFPAPFTNGSSIRFNLRVKIAGWSAGARMPDGYDGRVLTATASLSSTQTISSASSTKITINSSVEDSAGMFDSTNNRIYIRSSGYYDVDASTQFTTSTLTTNEPYFILIRLNGSSTLVASAQSAIANTAFVLGASRPGIKLNAGDYIELYVQSVSDTSYEVTGNINTRLTVKSSGGTPFMSPTASVAFRAVSSSGSQTFTSSPTTVIFTTKQNDTHNAYSTTTGIFTVPEPGTYSFHAGAGVAGVVATSDRILVTISTATASGAGRVVGAGSTQEYFPQAVLLGIKLNAGDTVSVTIQNASGTSMSVHNSTTSVYFSGVKTGP